MKVVSSCAIKDIINFFKNHMYLDPKKRNLEIAQNCARSLFRLTFVLPMSHFNNMSGQTIWCLTCSNCSEIIVDPSKSKSLRVYRAGDVGHGPKGIMGKKSKTVHLHLTVALFTFLVTA